VKLRPYQSRAVEGVKEAFREDRAVLLVAPTGSGKTVMGLEVVARTLRAHPDATVLWLAHRTELVEQARERAQTQCPDVADRIDVATVQALALGAEVRQPLLLVWDEAHHASPTAPHWHSVLTRWPDAWRFGMTATPQRGDGSPLGDTFGRIVVAAQYGELIEAGHLVPCRVMGPAEEIRDGLAQAPAAAWLEHAGGRQGFAFTRTIQEGVGLAADLTASGVEARCVHANTKPDERRKAVSDFKAGAVRCLVSVYVFTEGVDVPAAAVCMLARGAGAESTYLQMVGRVLRPHAGKDAALLLDLSGAAAVHGMPTDDRVYTLDGRGIGKAGEAREAEDAAEVEEREPVIWNVGLREVYAGQDTAEEHKRSEYRRLLRVVERKAWPPGSGLAWAGSEYKKLFKAAPPRLWVPAALAAQATREWRETQQRRGFRKGWIWYQRGRAWRE